ncbi:hypothetical protein L596_027741 [Steinernema carpocapsae]|uniref:Laminin G domain-containing protein n=1 Tax=Steinernema carpocapsae TaxID=34508 RepID=A0A4U5LWD3_STECR|nr:hypothetical protein L596_027741 [Steinernema carpocapsae]
MTKSETSPQEAGGWPGENSKPPGASAEKPFDDFNRRFPDQYGRLMPPEASSGMASFSGGPLWISAHPYRFLRKLLSLVLVLLFLPTCPLQAVILSGSPDSYARFPKWAHTFENELSFDFRTRQSNALLFYTDDGGINGNFYALTISDGRIQLDFRY